VLELMTAPLMYEAVKHERNAEAARRRWNVRLRELLAAERLKAAHEALLVRARTSIGRASEAR
jgi:hypothetical protein